jgi:hypothetical protein
MTKVQADPSSCLQVRITAVLGSTLFLLILAGCGVAGPTPPGMAVQNVALSGVVHGGQQPVTQSNIALYATSSGGYGGTLNPLATTQTGTGGSFLITSTITCPTDQTSQAYIVSTGGNPGLTMGTDNSAIFLVAALGSCRNISSATSVVINEVTTVAAAYALSGFAPAGGAGMTEAAVEGGTVAGITTSSTNTQGLTDAFANAANIVSSATGQAYTTTPGGNGTVPVGTINALADILQDCVNSSSPTSTACASLFSAAKPPTGSVVTATPANVFQAALDIAENPGNSVSTLFGLVSAVSAFPTTLSAAPNDWTIGVTYTSSLLLSGVGLGINAQDQVFVSGAGYLIDFSPQGAPLTTTNLLAGDAAITSSDSLREIAFDKSGNLFVTDGAYTGVYEYNPTTTALTALNFDVAPVSEANNNSYGIAIDGKNDVWTSSYSKATCATVTCPLVEFPSTATTTPTPYPAYTPFSTFGGFSAPQPTGALGGARGMAFDVNTGNVWITAIDDNLAEAITVVPSSLGVASASAAPVQIAGLGTEAGSPASNTAYGTISVAIDSTSRAWIVVMGGPAETGSHATSAIPAAIYPVTLSGGFATVGTAVTGGGLSTPTQISVDGNNNLFVANGSGSAAASAVIEYSPALGGFVSPSTGFIPSSTGTLYEPSYVSIDRSGAVWSLSSGNGTTHPANLLQILGVGAPTDPVLADGKYGVKP